MITFGLSLRQEHPFHLQFFGVITKIDWQMDSAPSNQQSLKNVFNDRVLHWTISTPPPSFHEMYVIHGLYSAEHITIRRLIIHIHVTRLLNILDDIFMNYNYYLE